MGNKWELDSEEIVEEVPCPCGKGEYQYIKMEYTDDYLNNHSSSRSEITCKHCAANYAYLGNREWITKANVEILKNLHIDKENYEKQIYSKLYDKAYNSLLSRFTTKKGLYEFLKANRIGYLPGTLGTFYKNGPNYYIGKKHLPFESIIKLIDLLSVGDDEDKKLISEYEIKSKKINEFVSNNSFKK